MAYLSELQSLWERRKQNDQVQEPLALELDGLVFEFWICVDLPSVNPGLPYEIGHKD